MAISKMPQGKRQNLFNICYQAIGIGRKLNLEGCLYGKPHWKGAPPTDSPYYYFFLAGLVKSQKLKYILELGTYYGGAIFSMYKGIDKKIIRNAKVVTVDVGYHNHAEFAKYPAIKRIKGFDLSSKTISKVMLVHNEPIDLLFIDSVHEPPHVWKAIKIYGTRTNPKFIVLDDIYLTPVMRYFWQKLSRRLKNNAIDATEFAGREGAGFGVIAFRNSPIIKNLFYWNIFFNRPKNKKCII